MKNYLGFPNLKFQWFVLLLIFFFVCLNKLLHSLALKLLEFGDANKQKLDACKWTLKITKLSGIVGGVIGRGIGNTHS